jgi:hypothetical protein
MTSFVPLHLVKVQVFDLDLNSKELSAGLETLSVGGSVRITCLMLALHFTMTKDLSTDLAREGEFY